MGARICFARGSVGRALHRLVTPIPLHPVSPLLRPRPLPHPLLAEPHPHPRAVSFAPASQAEFDNFVSEHGTGESLDKLDSLIARQPELPDGTRLPLTSVDEARNLIAQATLPAKRQHKLQLEQALREVEEENAGLQAQYAAALPELQAASAEIAACKAQVEKVTRRSPLRPRPCPVSVCTLLHAPSRARCVRVCCVCACGSSLCIHPRG